MSACPISPNMRVMDWLLVDLLARTRRRLADLAAAPASDPARVDEKRAANLRVQEAEIIEAMGESA